MCLVQNGGGNSKTLYYCKAANGPHIQNVGAISPASDTTETYWTKIIDEAGIVHRNGNEEITGGKTFPNGITLKHPGAVKGQETSTDQYISINMNGKNNLQIGSLITRIRSNGDSTCGLFCYDPNSDSGLPNSQLSIWYRKDGAVYALAPTTPSNSTANTIVTSDSLLADTRIVHTTGNETITGIKTFQSSNSNYNFILKSDSIDREGTLSSESKYLAINFQDSYGRALALFESCLRKEISDVADFRTDVKIAAFQRNQNGVFSSIHVGWDINDIACATAPSTSNLRTFGGDILTRDWIPKDNRIVHTTGNETIDGYKSFQYIQISLDNGGDFYLKSPRFAKGSTDSNFYSGISYLDKNDASNLQVVFHCYGSNGLRPEYCWYIADPLGTKDNTVLRIRRDRTTSTQDDNYFHPDPDNTFILGNSASRWKQIFAATATISTSDERYKEEISPVDDNVLDAWEEINWLQFKFIDAVEEKGLEKARIHNGLIAQRIDSIFKSHEIDTSKYAFFCYDKWEAEPEERDKKGNLLSKAKEAGDRYSIRYEEALCMEAAYQRRENSRLKQKISDLEEKLIALEEKLSKNNLI